MKVAFISNYLSHHQLPFCSELYATLGQNFQFISTVPMDQERMSMGWKIDGEYPFELSTYGSQDSMNLCRQIADTWDVAMIGSAPDEFITNRLKKGLLTFKYSERFYKSGTPLKRFPHDIAGAWLHHGRFQKYPLYMLCSSAYTAADAARFGNYKSRTFKWGYFPETVQYENIERVLDSKRPASILWAGRLIEWKHPEAAINTAKKLRDSGFDFEFNIIGEGNLREELQHMIDGFNLGKHVHLLGAMSPEVVRKHMEKSSIFLFTSDFNEGWGAVLNESMNSGCSVVASHAIGSVPYLIRHQENGLIYRSGDENDLYTKTSSLLSDSYACRKLGSNAYQTISTSWNAHNAATRFLNLAGCLRQGENTPFVDGPCSSAEILPNDWF